MGVVRSELARMRASVGAQPEAVRPVDVVIEVEGDVDGNVCAWCSASATDCTCSRTPIGGRPAVQVLWRTVLGPLLPDEPEAA